VLDLSTGRRIVIGRSEQRKRLLRSSVACKGVRKTISCQGVQVGEEEFALQVTVTDQASKDRIHAEGVDFTRSSLLNNDADVTTLTIATEVVGHISVQDEE